MERRRSGTRAGILLWTPTPGYSSSPPSPDGSGLSWDEGGEEDFESQMDENGIIGIRESLGEMDEEEEIVLEEEEDLLLDAGTPEPEEVPPPALEELSCHLSELLDSEPFSHHTGDDCPSPSNNDGDDSVALEDWSEDEDGQKLDEESLERLKIQEDSRPVGVKSMTIDDTEEVKVHREPLFCLREEMDPQFNCMESHDDNSNARKNNFTTSRSCRTTSGTLAGSQYCCDEEFILNERLHVSSSPLSSRNTPHSPVLPFLPQLSLEEQACNSGNGATETFPELAYTESKSHGTRLSCSPRSFQPVGCEEEKLEYGVIPQFGRSMRIKEDELERKVVGPYLTHHQLPIPSPQKISSALQESPQSSSPVQHAAKAQSSSSDSSPLSTPYHRRHRGHRPSKPSHTDLKDVRKGQLSHPLPDFSKVEPRVRFPKSGYKPPRSRRPPRKKDSKPDAPLVYRSPADIVREVLLSSTEGLSDAAAPGDPQGSLNSTAPTEFQCALQASTLVQQLQEDYNRLLTKYAEAENTIDRLRLEAKVGIYSDPPKASQPALPGVLQEGSKVMMLSFPQAQRAELSTNNVHPSQERINSEPSRGTSTLRLSVDHVSSMLPVSLAAIQLTEALSNHVQRFQLQVEEFEELLKSGKLRPYEQRQGLSQLAQGQSSLERTYLDARDQYQQLQKQAGGKSGCFDPDRELEGLIFNSGMRLEEMKERIEQSEQYGHVSDPGPNPPPHAYQPSASLNETDPQPESPISAVNAEGMVGMEVSSVSGDSAGDREENEEEILPSLLNPLHEKHQHVEKDFNSLMNHFQNFRELPKLLDRGPCEDAQDSLEFRDSSPQTARNDGIDLRQHGRTKDKGDSSKSFQPSPTAVSLFCPSSHSHGYNSMETLPEAPLPARILLGQQAGEMRPAGTRKPHSSLGKSANLEERASKEHDGVLRAAPQDGVISPETDSGFVGSESSRLTPAAHSPVQQRAAVRPSVTQEKSNIKPETVSVSGQLPRSLAHIHASPGHSGRGPGSTGRGGETERQTLPNPSTSSSPLRWTSGHLQPWPSSGISELEQQSDSAQSLSGEDVQQGDQYTKPSSQNGCYLRSPSSAMLYHHGDHLKAQSSVQLTNHHEALQSLQEEVDRLRERLKGSLRMTSPISPVRAPPSVLADCRNHKPSHTSTPLQATARSLEQRAASKRGPRENRRSEEEEQGERRRIPMHIPRRSASLPRFRPDLDITTDSDHAESEPKPQTSRHIPASLAAAHSSQRARAKVRQRTEPCTKSQQNSISADRSEEGDDEAEDSRGPAPLCMCCLARYGSRGFAPPTRNVGSPSRTPHYSRHCPLCGARVSPPEHQNSAQRETKSVSSRHKYRGGVCLAGPLPPPVMGSVHVVQCVPVCPSVLYYSTPVAPSSNPKPLYLSRSEDRGYRSGVRGPHRRSRSVDTQHSLNSSLSRAVTAASSMKEVSRRMARSLASGLQHTSPIAQSYTY
ncbi:microtubule organization protein AKNA isoform X2 [Pygocentrus nattereri]|uniref:microtubule organization protein AKNA isoform X2 n=1 Tax=Pygocentrus nattereri TaxID=42514 RepID=UPI000814888A|nr:microtubule organization protein AKNA isoform X2 [Pygocentrus nattereri]